MRRYKKVMEKEKKLLVLIPVYNEEENIQFVVEELQKDVPYANILAINDCSSDSSEVVLKKCNIPYLNTPYNFGYAGVLQTGFKYAVQNDYPYIAQFDGDGQHVAAELDKMFKTMQESKTDIMLGSRFLKKTSYHHPLLRRFGTSLFKVTIRIISGKKITDPTSGLQILSRDVFSRYAKIYNYPEYPDANLLTEMVLTGFSVQEVAVEMREREFGESMHSGLLKSASYMVKMLYSLILIIFKYPGKKKKHKK
jgi:glycosyltransferase involved in cell wall biosynthesis